MSPSHIDFMSNEINRPTADPSLDLRPLQIADLPQILALQARQYPEPLLESAAVIGSKISHCASGWVSWGMFQGTALCAYALAYPWRWSQTPCWNQVLEQPQDCDTLYLHDVAVDPGSEGRGFARQLVARHLGQGRQFGLRQAMLVAVTGAEGYWLKQGFVAVADGRTDPAFGADAVLMRRRLDAGDAGTAVGVA